jgi:hypothetical protein
MRQPGTPGGDARPWCRPCEGKVASEYLQPHPWCPEPHAAAIRLLPGTVGNLLGDDGVASCHDGMDQPDMQTLALGGQCALQVGQAPPGRSVPLAVVAGLTAPFAASSIIVMLWVVGPPLSVQLALQASLGVGVGGHPGAKDLNRAGHDGNGGRAEVQSLRLLPNGTPRLLVGHSFEGQLSGGTEAVPAGTFGARTGGFASPEPGIFDVLLDHRVGPVDERRDALGPPDEPVPVALAGLLEHEADPLLALQAREPASSAAEAEPPGSAPQIRLAAR